MKYLPPVAVLLLLPFALLGSPLPPVQFLEANLPEVRQMAAREGKLYFIHFAADWCMTSQWMEKHTFTDEPLSDFLDENYLALRADIDRPEGQALKEQYEVNILPTILVFSSQGQLLGRHEGAMEPEVLLDIFKGYDRPANRIQAALAALEEDILPSPRAILGISRPALIPDVEPRPVSAAATPRPRPRPVTPASTPSGENASPPAPAPTAIFTIQAGVFSSYDNAIRFCSTLETKVAGKAEITPFQLNGQALYKVFLGRFNSQAEAAAHLQGLRKKEIEGFVKIMEK